MVVLVGSGEAPEEDMGEGGGGGCMGANIPGSVPVEGTINIRFLYFFITVSYPGGANSLYEGAGVGGAVMAISSGLFWRRLQTLSEQTMTTKNRISSKKVEKYQIIVIRSIFMAAAIGFSYR